MIIYDIDNTPYTRILNQRNIYIMKLEMRNLINNFQQYIELKY